MQSRLVGVVFSYSRKIEACTIPPIYKDATRASKWKPHKFYHNFSPQNNGAHVKVIPPLGVSYSNENKLVRHYSKTVRETTKNVSSGLEPISVQSANTVPNSFGISNKVLPGRYD